ncbi:2-nitropropane dioxygenase [Cristinia sonorae]|uniref:2-nitropropane dioxygenase n=1 Tax=Cristinia sonorae TaxID=1940300 RepID=A0A8K0UUB3_9AGAR|nr:2-nitropropane dioxygenase [Cristinia sonorae]
MTMQPIQTRLTQRLNLKTPIISAAMAIPGVEDIAYAVTKAGGFGFVGNAMDGSATIKERMQRLRAKLGVLPRDPLPMGFGLLGWLLDKSTDDDRVAAILEGRPTAIWLAFGEDIGKYIQKVHDYEAGREHKTLVFVIVNSVAEALKATNEWKVDALVVQGNEAGGHGGAGAPPMFDLVQAVLKAVPRNGPFVIAAGGISTGAQIAALLTMGVDGVTLGTRFLFTNECAMPEAKKHVLVEADLHATTRSLAFDEVNRTMGWPNACDGRAISNAIIKDEKQGLSLEERLKLFDEGTKKGEKDRLVIWAGVGAGLTNEIKPAADVLRELHQETVEHLRAASSLLA